MCCLLIFAYRSAAFSLALGLLFSGVALGPTIGSLLIHFTGKILSVFYLSAALHVLYAISVFFLVPESLSANQMKESRARYAESGRGATNPNDQGAYVYVLLKLRSFFAFLTPLAVFLPVSDPHTLRPGKKSRRDWSMTIMVIGYASMVSITVCFSSNTHYIEKYLKRGPSFTSRVPTPTSFNMQHRPLNGVQRQFAVPFFTASE